jgi:hypothetical protein
VLLKMWKEISLIRSLSCEKTKKKKKKKKKGCV